MRRKKSNGIGIFKYIALLLVALLIVSFAFFAFPFAVIDTPGGNQYYEERCIDTSQYEADGYKLDHIDDNGCRVVTKKIAVSKMKGSYSASGCYSNDLAKSGTKYCPTGFTGCGCYSSYSNKCCAYSLDYKGGTERVINTCDFDPNDLLAGETFAGGKSIDKYSTRYPIKSFCKAHPAIFTDNTNRQSITSTNVYDDLVEGKSVTVPEGQTLTLFYVMENNGHLPTICSSDNNQALNVNTENTCLSTLGFSYFCSEGQFDALTGTCVIQAESELLCEQGRYDVSLGKCIYNPPVQADCGAAGCFYSVDRDICVCYAKDEFNCPEGFRLVQPTSIEECKVERGVWDLCPQCPADKVCPDSICEARCSVGQVCVWDSPLIQKCKDANAQIVDGECVIYEDGQVVTTCPEGTTLRDNACYRDGVIQCPDEFDQVGIECIKQIDGEVVTVCPDGLEYNDDEGYCEKEASTRLVCEDGSAPKLNSVTGQYECITLLPVFHDCAADELYDHINDRCVKQINVYDPDANNFTIYKEIQTMCTSDSECKEIDPGLACNKEKGICYTDIDALRVETIVLNQTIARMKSLIWQVLIGVVIIFSILLYIFRRKPKRRKR